jgi:hypothetical protein
MTKESFKYNDDASLDNFKVPERTALATKKRARTRKLVIWQITAYALLILSFAASIYMALMLPNKVSTPIIRPTANDIFSHPDWNFIVTIFGIFLGILGLMASVRFNFGKELIVYPGYENLSPDKSALLQRHQITLTFQNLSKQPLFARDFLIRRFAEIEGIENLESLRVESDCEFNTAPVTILKDRIIVEIDFLEAKKLVKLTFIFYSSRSFNIRLRTKVIGGNSIDENISFNTIYDHIWAVGHKTADAYFFKFLVLLGIFNAIIWQITRHVFNINYDSVYNAILKWNKDSFVVIILGLFGEATIVLISFHLIKFIFVPYAEKAKKVKIFYRKN